jgi:hypothetical protein
LRRHLNLPDAQLTIVGRITSPSPPTEKGPAGDGEAAARVRVIDAKGADVSLPAWGWQHLAQTGPGGSPTNQS